MEVLDFVKIIVGLNGLILIGIIANTLRIGKLEGRLKNGDYLRCPFYRGNKNTSKCRDDVKSKK